MTSLGTSGIPSPMRETRTRKKEKLFQHIAQAILLCDVGDPKFTALARASGGWSIIKTFNKLLDRPPDEVLKEMGKGEEGVDIPEDDWNELTALVPYITWEWNCHGPTEDKSDPFDYDSLTRERFETFLARIHSSQKHNHYDRVEAQENKDKRRKEREKEREEREKVLEAEAREEKRRLELRDKEREAAAREEKRGLELESLRDSVRSRKSDDKSGSGSTKSKRSSSSAKSATRIASNVIQGRSIVIPKVGGENDIKDSDKDDDISDQTPHNSARDTNAWKNKDKKQGSKQDSKQGSKQGSRKARNGGGDDYSSGSSSSSSSGSSRSSRGNGSRRKNNKKRTSRSKRYSSATPSIEENVSAAIASFDKGVRRNPESFKEIKRISGFQPWWRHFTATIRAQRLSQLLDRHYVPVTDEERELFGRYNDYMYAVLLEKVKITKGAQIVRRHDDAGNFNAQLAIQEIRDHYMGVASKVAAMTKEQSLTELSTSRLSLQDTGTTLGEQINKFHELVLTINNLSDADSQLSPGQQLTFFKTFIENVPDMKAAAVFINMGMNAGSVANPEEAMELYEDRARGIDEDRKKLLSSRRGHRQLQAMMHDGELTHEQLAYMCDAYDVNMSEAFGNEEDVQAYYGDVRGAIPADRFRLASDRGREIWDTIPPEDKNIFAGIGFTPAPPSARGRRPQGSRPPNGRRRPTPRAPQGQAQVSAQETEINMGVTFDDDVDEATDNEDETIQVASALSTIEHCLDHNDDGNDDDDGLHVLQALIQNPVSLGSIENAHAGVPAGKMTRFLSSSAPSTTHAPMSAPAPKAGESKKGGNLRSILKLAGIRGKQKKKSNQRVYYTSMLSGDDSSGGGYTNAEEAGIIDSGCIHSIAGRNMQLIGWDHNDNRGVAVKGYGDSERQVHRVGTFGTLAQDTLGQAVILVFPQYLGNEAVLFPRYLEDGATSPSLSHTLHSTLQLRDNNVSVHDTPRSQGGRQQIVINGRQFNLDINGGHISLPSRRYSVDEWNHLDRITVTRARPWRPDRYDGNNNITIARYTEPIAMDTIQSYPLPDNAGYHAWISRSERELHRLHGRDNINGHNDVGSDSEDGENDGSDNEDGEGDDSEHIGVGNIDNEGEDDDSITLIGNESRDVDTINTNSAETMHNNGEQSGNADRYAHRINMFEICNELINVVESVNEEHLASNVLRQLYSNNRQQLATVYLDREKKIWISYKMKHDGRIKARLVCAGR